MQILHLTIEGQLSTFTVRDIVQASLAERHVGYIVRLNKGRDILSFVFRNTLEYFGRSNSMMPWDWFSSHRGPVPATDAPDTFVALAAVDPEMEKRLLAEVRAQFPQGKSGRSSTVSRSGTKYSIRKAIELTGEGGQLSYALYITRTHGSVSESRVQICNAAAELQSSYVINSALDEAELQEHISFRWNTMRFCSPDESVDLLRHLNHRARLTELRGRKKRRAS